MKGMKSQIVGVSIACLFLFSCVPQHKIVYLQSASEKQATEYHNQTQKNTRIESFDLLYITINSTDQQGFNLFAQEKQSFTSISDATLAVISYAVTDSGNVHLPVIGNVSVRGLTLEQAAARIEDSAKSILSKPIVNVRFVNTNVTILGEVLRPGNYPYTNEELTIFRAIGLAGDITEYGNRKEVVLIREKNKVITKYTLDLTSDDLFKSDFYYLRPNDLIYVKPLKIRRFGMKEYPFALVVTAVSSAFLVFYYVKK
jgi:polysaccharide export outer membrane protein